MIVIFGDSQLHVFIGQKKQQQWIGKLHELLETTEIDSSVRHITDRILEQDNIPRKRPKVSATFYAEYHLHSLYSVNTLTLLKAKFPFQNY